MVFHRDFSDFSRWFERDREEREDLAQRLERVRKGMVLIMENSLFSEESAAIALEASILRAGLVIEVGVEASFGADFRFLAVKVALPNASIGGEYIHVFR